MLWAISDLHVSHAANREIVASLRPESANDWLLLPGDVAEQESEFEWVISTLAKRFERVVWAPGNHDLWCTPADKVKLPGILCYQRLVNICRRYNVATPEDKFLRYTTEDGTSVVLAPVLTLFDYSFKSAMDHTPAQAIERARRQGVMSSDELFLKTYPYNSVIDWCSERIIYTEKRLNELSDDDELVLISHYPLIQEPTRLLKNSEFSIWCGTEKTRKWLTRYGVRMVVYGHLHLPGVNYFSGIAHVEVSLGSPNEWRNRPTNPGLIALDNILEKGKYGTESEYRKTFSASLTKHSIC